jgi:hypothetical protein
MQGYTCENMNDIRIPDGLSPEAVKAARAILGEIANEGGEVYTGGCRLFYSPAEWAEKGEKYGLDAEFIVVHDGGSAAPRFNWNYGNSDAIESMRIALERVGHWAEACTCWYSAIYKDAEPAVKKSTEPSYTQLLLPLQARRQ